MILITDRTPEDVALVATLKAKFIVVDNVGSYIEISDLGGGKHLVFTGTASELSSYNAGLKGAWNYTDLNRIGNALRELQSAFEAIGVSIDVVGKNDWSVGDIPSISDCLNIVEDVRVAQEAGSVPGWSVESLDGITYMHANRIEEIIYEAYQSTQRVNGNFNHCGPSICGLGGVIT